MTPEYIRERPSMFIGDTGEKGLHSLVKDTIKTILVDPTITYLDISLSGPIVNGRQRVGFRYDGTPERALTDYVKNHIGLNVVSALSSTFEKFASHYYNKYNSVNVESNRISFIPDVEIFGDRRFSFDILRDMVELMGYLHSNIAFNLHDHLFVRDFTYKHENGLIELVKKLTTQEVVGEPIYFKSNQAGMEVEVAIQRVIGPGKSITAYVNDELSEEGGVHVEALRGELDMFKFDNYAAVLSVRLENPKFEGQSKTKLINGDGGFYSGSLYYSLVDIIADNLIKCRDKL